MMRRIGVTAAVLCLAIGWTAGFFMVNRDVSLPVVQTFPKGEAVAVGEDFFSYGDEEMDGYLITVLDAELLPAAAFLKRCGEEGNAELLGIFTDYIYVVRIRVTNESNPYEGEKGIPLQQYVLKGTDYILSLEESCFLLSNPKMPGASFSLKKGTSMEMNLTFDVMSQTVSLEHLREDVPKLVISQYPHQKMINIL